ncbi:LLM class flavin-dependent oxidoreductase [Gordonia sp. NPDC058843]|uniref:LLM class flavin-dependent oxidoreductase n=1 Tax=Gordonia sp. NPDC058843 TaxID=3346648 RepID=UPI0036856A6D
MKFGLFYEMFVPSADPEAEARIVRNTVDQIVHADKHGFDYVWLSEHHFLQGFSHMSAPEVIFGAAAYQTDRIRFGFGLALTPPAYNHPVRVAEKVSMLDCLSGGRVDLGCGRSTTPAELYGFGLDPDESRGQWSEGLEAVAHLLAEENVEFDGRYVTIPRRTVVPRPVQKPHPPLWVGGVGPGDAERAAKKGLGMLFFAHRADYEVLTASTAAYHENIDKAEPICGMVNNQTAGFVNGLVSYDRDEVRQLAARKTVEHTFNGSTHRLAGWPAGEPPNSYAHLRSGENAWVNEAIAMDRATAEDFMTEGGFVMAGNPDDCAPFLDAFQKSGVDQVIIHMQMGDMPHDRIMESIEIMGGELIPHYR